MACKIRRHPPGTAWLFSAKGYLEVPGVDEDEGEPLGDVVVPPLGVLLSVPLVLGGVLLAPGGVLGEAPPGVSGLLPAVPPAVPPVVPPVVPAVPPVVPAVLPAVPELEVLPVAPAGVSASFF